MIEEVSLCKSLNFRIEVLEMPSVLPESDYDNTMNDLYYLI